MGWDYTRAWLVDGRLEKEGVYFVPHQKVTILLPGQMVLDVAESINIINTGLQTRFLGEGIMVSKAGLVVGCYRFIDNHDNTTMTRMVCFHDALTTPEGTRVTQQQLEEFGTRWIPGTFFDEGRRAAMPKQGQKKGKKSTAAAPSAPAVPRTRAVDLIQLNKDEPVLFSPLGELDAPPLTETPGLALRVGTQSNTQSNRKTSSWLPMNPYPGPVKKGTPQPERLTIVKKHQATGLTKAVKYPHADNVDWNHQDWIRKVNIWARQNYRRSDENDRVESYKDRSRFLQIEREWLVAYVHLQIVKRGVDTFNKHPHWDEATDAFNKEFEGRQIKVDGEFTEPRSARKPLSISSECNRNADIQKLRGLGKKALKRARNELTLRNEDIED